jgi:cephalosporin-C deacetylase-like acetyl esterase
MTEPDDFGYSAFQTLAHVGEPTRSARHTAFWKAWAGAVFAQRPRLMPRDERSADPSDLTATHGFQSARSVRIGCSLVAPARGRARAGVVVTHGYSGVPTLGAAAEDWRSAADAGAAVLVIRVRGYPGSQADAAGLVGHAAAPEGGGGLWITHGLEAPPSEQGLGSEWSFSFGVADTVNACRALRQLVGGAPIFLAGESLGAALAVVAASALADTDEVARLAIGLPSMGDWPWRLSLPEGRAGGGAGGMVRRFVADHPELAEDVGATLRLFDAAIHARRVRCPVLCKLAERDDVVPAPAAAAVFNALGTDPGRKWRFVVRYGHFDGGIADARRHAHFQRLAREFLDPSCDAAERDWDVAALTPAMAAPGRRAGSPEPVTQSLFGGERPGPDTDDALIEAYVSTGRTLDDLPYTPEFDRLHRAVAASDPGRTLRDVFHRLHNLRKAGRLPRLGKPTGKPARISPEDESVLAGMVAEAAGSLGQRDQLPYTPAFDGIVERFNQRTGRALSAHDVWRVVAKLAK